jgi:cytochrome c oxidase accessory protein FixG
MSGNQPGKRVEIRWPDLDTVYSINPDGSRNFLHPADVRGRYQRRKNLIFALLILVYAALPWIPVGGHPAVQIDIPGRRAFLFGSSFGNQDFYLMFFLVTGMGFALFVVTTLWGRIWCGYACPQTVFLEGVFRRVERWIEGPRTQRIRRNLGPWTADKIRRKALKHAVFLVFSLGIAHIFLSYFIPVSELRHVLFSGPRGHGTAFFWSMFWTGALYFDYAWFREQTCLIICPYGRLQSALIDNDTVVVGYDRARGEPRSKLSDEGGDCVDCHRCVVVCPTGIDIRNGLQMECVGCANCVDACDEVMAKVGRAPGLIRYDSRRGFEGEGKRPLFRPRVILYAALGLIGLSVFLIAASSREPFDLKVLRARGLPYTLEGDHIRDLYTLRIENKEPVNRVLSVRAGVAPEASAPRVSFLVSVPRVELAGLSEAEIPVFATLPRADYSGHFPLRFTVTDSASGTTRAAEALFRGP